MTNAIKFAKPEDITQIVALGYQSFKENELEGIGADPDFDTVINNITTFVVDDVVLVKRAEDPKHLAGVLAFTHTSVWWSKQPLLMETLFYIKPEHRNIKAAKELINAAKEYSDEMGIPLVMDIFSRKDVESKSKLLIHCGFMPLGTLYIYHPK